MAAADDLAWTTSRCNRLLRPLATKLAKLRKELERPRSAGGEGRKGAHSFASRASPRRSANVSQPPRKPRGAEHESDQAWFPAARAAAASRKTYGARGAKKAGDTQRGPSASLGGRPGEIAFTPLIARTASRSQESPQTHGSPLRKHAKHRGPLLVEDLQQIREQMPLEVAGIVRGLSEAYANLLQATATSDAKRWKGTRSLFGACLRTIPGYIELEEHFAEVDKDEDNDEDRDIAQEIYNHLEAQFETTAGQGWRPLKQIVRAHGTSLLCEAIADQILGQETLHLLVSHCLKASAWDEAEKFLWSYLPGLKPINMPINLQANLFDEQRSPYLFMIKVFVDRTGRHRVIYDILEYMISQELLPLEWLATECMRPVWDRLVRGLFDGDQRITQNAFRFLETSILAGIGLPDESLFEEGEVDIVSKQLKPSSRLEFRNALTTTYSSLLTMFCSIALINRSRKEEAGELAVRRVTWVLDAIVVGLLKRNDMREDLELLNPVAEDMQVFAQRAVWTGFAAFAAHLEDNAIENTTVQLDVCTLVSGLNWILSQYSSKPIDASSIFGTLPEFIASAARATGRVWQDDGFDQLQRLVQCLLSLSGARLPHKLWTFKRLALESAMEFAHSTRDGQHMAYAREVEKTMRSKGYVVIQQSPQKNDSPSTGSGFRWEEGIGEWVACTPFARQEAKRTVQKPVRALQLLPTPEPSQSEASLPAGEPTGGAGLTTDAISSKWKITIPDDSEDAILSSSPVKNSTSSTLGKRTRPSSPMVVIPAKPARQTPPASSVTFYPELPRNPPSDGPRRSLRTRTEICALVKGLRTRRSRSSLDKGLRNLERKKYSGAVGLAAGLSTSDDEFQETASSAASGAVDRRKKRTWSRRYRTAVPYNESDESDVNTSFSSSSSIESRKSVGCQSARALASPRKRKALQSLDVDEKDELSETPFVKKRTSVPRRTRARREWWRVSGGAALDAESEDELSFQ